MAEVLPPLHRIYALQPERLALLHLPFSPHLRRIIPKIVPEKLVQVGVLLNRREADVAEPFSVEPDSDDALTCPRSASSLSWRSSRSPTRKCQTAVGTNSPIR